MLLANVSVAKKIYEHFPEHAVLRKHPVPSPSMFETLTKSATSLVSSTFRYFHYYKAVKYYMRNGGINLKKSFMTHVSHLKDFFPI